MKRILALALFAILLTLSIFAFIAQKNDGGSETIKVAAAETNQIPESAFEHHVITSSITNQIRRCWKTPRPSIGAVPYNVMVDVDIERDGTITFVGFTNGTVEMDNEQYKAAANIARAAVMDPKCNPLKKIPPLDKYDIWNELTINFDPQKII